MSGQFKPCPFCNGSANLHNNDGDFWYVACRECINQTTHFDNGKDVVVARWNTRTNTQPSQAFEQRLAVLTDALEHYADRLVWDYVGDSCVIYREGRLNETSGFEVAQKALAESDRIAQTEVVSKAWVHYTADRHLSRTEWDLDTEGK